VPATLGLITLLQLFPAFLIVHAALRKQWRVVVGALLCVLLAMTTILQTGHAVAQTWGNTALSTVPIIGPVLTVALLVCYVAGVLRFPQADGLLTYAWAVCTMLVLAPVVWPFGLTWLLPVYLLCYSSLPAGARPPPTPVAARHRRAGRSCSNRPAYWDDHRARTLAALRLSGAAERQAADAARAGR
jgi:hypothetical protein